tara:strand:+ start:41 stop:1750 length:1710 start_codon:yes stop_codon:yes gene_type:complete
MAEEKSGLDKFRDLYLPTVRKYEKKLADTLSYVAGPELTKLGQGILALRPLQDIPDATEFIKNPSLKTGLDLAGDTAITAAELTPFGYLASRGATLPGKVAQEVTEGIRPVDDIINQKIVPKKDVKIDFNDIYTNPIKRKDRVKIRNETVNDKELNDLINQISKEEKFSEDTVSKFANVYNSKNPFKIEYLSSSLTTDTGSRFKSLRKKAIDKKLITDETSKSVKGLLDKKIENLTDLKLGKLEEQLRKYKGANPNETGMNLRVNKFGEFDINDIFKLDDDLKDLVNNKSSRQKIIKKLEKEGILDELDLGDLNIQASKPKTISDPQIDQYLKDLNLNYLPKKFDFTSKILNPQQKKIYSDLQKKVTNSIGSNQAVKDMIRENVNRMIKYGVRDQGKTVDEVIASLQKQTNSNEFLGEVVPLMLKKIKAQKNIEKFREAGIDLDDVNLGHMKAVVEDVDQTFKLNNIFIGLSKKNTAESVIQKKIRNLNKQLDEKGGSVANKNKIKADIEDLQYELKTGNYYEPVPETYIEDQLFFPEMMRTGPSAKKDGGMMNINDITGPLGKFSSQI